MRPAIFLVAAALLLGEHSGAAEEGGGKGCHWSLDCMPVISTCMLHAMPPMPTPQPLPHHGPSSLRPAHIIVPASHRVPLSAARPSPTRVHPARRRTLCAPRRRQLLPPKSFGLHTSGKAESPPSCHILSTPCVTCCSCSQQAAPRPAPLPPMAAARSSCLASAPVTRTTQAMAPPSSAAPACPAVRPACEAPGWGGG